jgi:polyribonucleotide nucleotidyltransferase
VPSKAEREAALGALKEESKLHLAEVYGTDTYLARQGEFGPAWKDLQKKVMRKRVIDEGIRLDGARATSGRSVMSSTRTALRSPAGDTQV